MGVVFDKQDMEAFPYEVSTNITLHNKDVVEKWLEDTVQDSGTYGDPDLWKWISNSDYDPEVGSYLMLYRFKHEDDAIKFALTFI